MLNKGWKGTKSVQSSLLFGHLKIWVRNVLQVLNKGQILCKLQKILWKCEKNYKICAKCVGGHRCAGGCRCRSTNAGVYSYAGANTIYICYVMRSAQNSILAWPPNNNNKFWTKVKKIKIWTSIFLFDHLKMRIKNFKSSEQRLNSVQTTKT